MRQNSTRGYLIIAILLIVFSAIAILPPFSKTAVFFAAYCFGLISILSQIYFFMASFSEGGSVKSKFYGFPIARIGVIYLIAQLIISLLEMTFSAFLPMWVACIINIVVAGAAFAGCIAADTMREEIERQDSVLKKDVSAMRELQSLAGAIVDQCGDVEMKKNLQKIADELRYSDPVTSEASAPLEKELLGQLKKIQEAVRDNDVEVVKALSGKMLADLTERNRICKLNK